MKNVIPFKIYNDNNRFTIDWTLNTLCTYKCSYCPPSLNSGKNIIFSKDLDLEVAQRFLETLETQIKDRSVHLFLNGGEPTISHLFEPILDFCENAGWTVYVNTNLSRSLDWWKIYGRKIYKITVSYHPEFSDEEIFNKIQLLSAKTNMGVFVLMFPPLWEKSVAAFEKFKTFDNIHLEPSRVFKRNLHISDESYIYSEYQLEWLHQNSGMKIIPSKTIKLAPERSYWGQTYVQYSDESIQMLDEVQYVNERKNSFEKWNCKIGVDHIFIQGNGNIYSGTCSSSQKISNLQTFISLPSSDIVCKTKWCMCTAEVMVEKENKHARF